MKKLVSLLVCLALALSCCVAFAAETREELLAENVTLSIMTWDNYYAAASFADNLPVYQQFAENQNVTLEWELASSSQYGTVLQTRLAAAVDLPDIINLGWYGDIGTYGANGIFLPLEDLINEVNTPNMIATFAEHPILPKLITSPDGHIYRFAEYLSHGEMEGGSYALTLRGDWLERLGLEVPTTTEELYNVLVAFRDQDANGNGDPSDEIPMADSYSKFSTLAISFGCNMRGGNFDVDDNGNVFFCKASEEYREFLRYVNRLYSEGLLDPEFATMDDDQAEEKEAHNIIGGRASLWVDEMPFSEQMIQNADPEGYYVMLDPLADNNGHQGAIMASAMVYSTIGISKDCEHPDRALSFLDYTTYDPYATILCNCGTEELCWNFAEDGKTIVFTDFVMNNPDGLSPMEAIRSTGGYHTMAFDVIGQARKAMNVTNERISGYIDSLAENIFDPVCFGAATAEEAQQEAVYSRDIQVLTDEMQLLFMTGEMNLDDDWDTYVEQLNAIGLAEYTAIYQARYDRVYKD